MLGIVLALLAAVLDLLAVAFGWHPVEIVAKPLPALILAVLAWRAGNGLPTRLLACGLILAAAGDELLVGTSTTSFLAGMGAFAAMQLLYVGAFLAAGAATDRRAQPAFGFFGLLASVGCFGFAYVWIIPAAGPMKVPVAIYSFLLMTMVWTALFLPPRMGPSRAMVAGGALIFMISDLTLAYGTFFLNPRLGATASDLIVMGTYFLAQLLITLGMTNAAKQNAEHHQTLAQESPGHL